MLIISSEIIGLACSGRAILSAISRSSKLRTEMSLFMSNCVHQFVPQSISSSFTTFGPYRLSCYHAVVLWRVTDSVNTDHGGNLQY